jgi:hypothetical protein
VSRPPSGRTSFKPGPTGKLYPRVNSGDWRFGHVCPTCAGPKTDQALRCRKCFSDDKVTNGRFRKGVMHGKRWLHESRLEP